jgi:16S rRNA (guanine966-N2)-methyltransferase
LKKKSEKALLTIIGGSLKGEKIVLETEPDVRPTRQQVREAVFQIWAELIQGAVLLDPFAGSGAIVIEALSRGAEEIYASDIRADRLFDLKKKLKSLERKRPGLVEPLRIVLSSADYREAIGEHFASRRKFDLIYLDPPYQSGMGIEAIRLIARYELLNTDGRVMLEVSKRELASIERFLDEDIVFLMKKYHYGETYLFNMCINEDF